MCLIKSETYLFKILKIPFYYIVQDMAKFHFGIFSVTINKSYVTQFNKIFKKYQ